MRKILPLLLLSCLSITKLSAQVTGTKTIGGDYTTLAAAIADLNATGISGNVVINVPSGYTETAPVGGYLLGSATLNASTSAASTLTIQKSGATANPLLTAPIGTSTTVDGIFFIQGADYVTIDGIDIAEDAGNATATTQMEFGYALVKLQNVTPFDGCQNVTIKNCTITLNRLNIPSVGIYAGNHIATSTTALAITAPTDAMNNCIFRSNTIQNSTTGISLRGYAAAASPYTLYDQNNIVGGSSTTGNIIQNYGGANLGSGINLQYQNNDTVSYNAINNIAGSGVASTGGLYGVYVQNGTNASVSVANNTFNMTVGTTANSMYGINIGCSGTGTVNLDANTFTASGGSTGVMYMIYFAVGNTNINLTNNNFNNINVATTANIGLMYTAVAASTLNMYCYGNYTSGSATPYVSKTGAGGTFYGYYNASASTAGTTTISNNNISNVTLTGATAFIGLYESNGNTLSAQTKFVRNNVVSNIVTGGISAASPCYGIAVGGANTMSISNCRVSNMNGGAGNVFAIYHWTATTDTINNCRVTGITSTGGNAYGIVTSNVSTTSRIYGDTVSGVSTTFSTGLAYGIYQAGAANAEIYKNTLYDISASGAGGSVNGMYLNAGANTVWNNLVGDLRTPAYTTATANSGTQLVGIYCGAGTSYNLYYNTVYLNGTSTGANFGSSAVFAATGNAVFNNNIFINTSTPAGTGMVAAYRRSATGLTGYQASSNYNLFYAGTPAANSVIMYDGTAAYQTLAAYKTLVTPRDAGSVTENVAFQSIVGGTAGFLKPSITTATQVEGNGINITGITDDIYGTVRAGNVGYADTGAAPDLGAVEANYLPLDLSAPVIVYTPFTTTCATGNRTLTATLTDVSGVPVSGTLMPRIYYKKGSGSWFSNTGALASGNSRSGTWNFTIVASDMGGVAGGDVISYFVVAQDSASTPNLGSNGVGVAATDVNIIGTYPATPNNYLVGYASGTFNVGVGQTFATITAAVNSYNANTCLTGPVTFLLTDATYPGETFPITINNNALASATATLTIRPATGMSPTITGSGAPVFDFNGAQYVTIDGRVGSTGTTKALTISNTTTNAATVRFANGASYDTLKYCTLLNVNTTTATGTVFFSTSTGATGNSNNVIDNCDFLEGSTPYVQGIYSSGTTGKENSNNTVSNCSFANYFSATIATCGISLSTASSDWTITNNRFYQTTAKTYTTANTHRAILISNTSGNGFAVTNNIIGYASSAGTGTYSMGGTVVTTFRGIELSVGTTTPSSVQGNTITNMSLSGTTGTLTGILIASGSADVGTTAGNTIGATTGTGAITITNTATSSNIISGITSSSASPAIVNVQNNNIGGITVTGSTTAGSGMTGIFASSNATVTISGNTIGSAVTANSMNSTAVTTGAVAMGVLGISSTLSSAAVISNNIIANMNCAATSTSALMAGISHSGSGAVTISGNTVRNLSGAIANSVLNGQTGISGIAYTGTGAANVIQNTVNAISGTNTGSVQSNVAGIAIHSSANGSITRNRIYDLRNASTMTTAATPPTAIGINIGVPGGTSTTIVNNMISLGNSQTTNTQFMGIANVSTTTSVLRVYHNSINIEGTASGALPTIGFNRGNNTTTAITSTIDFKNNIINNTRTGGTGKHYAIVNGLLVTAGSATGWPANASNYNVLNANPATVGFWSSDKTLASWRTASAGDLNSYSGVTATFTNAATGDLHLNMGITPNYIESHGTAVTVTNDYDNDSRPGPIGSVNGGGVIPDLGADEFDGVSIDDVAPSITHAALGTTCTSGDRTLTATIVDQSGVPVAGSGTEPRVYYKKGLSGTWYFRPGVLSSGTVINGTWTFTIVATDMGGISAADRVYYYIAAQDIMSTSNVGASPGIGFAATSVASITTPPTTPNNYFVSYSSGTFNVGVGQTFATITEAVNSYNTNTCLSGPVAFLLTDALYSTSETFPIVINNNPLANATATLTIKPATGVAATVTGSATATAVFKLLNAQFITIDGVNTSGSGLTLNNSNTGASAVIWLASTATTGPGNKNISLLNTNMNGGLSTGVSNWGIIACADAATPAITNGMDNDSITVQGNYIKRCGYALWLGGTAATAAGGLNGWVIRNNILGPWVYNTTENLGVNGLFMRNMTNVNYSGNTLQNVGYAATPNGIAGMYMESNIDGILIDSNVVDSVLTNATGAISAWAYYLGGSVKNVTFSRNKISSIYSMNTGGYGSRAIQVTNGTAASNVNIVNNFISDIVGYSSTSVGNWPIGISVDGTSGGVNIYNNSINLYGSHPGLTTATGSADIYISTSGVGIDVRNNLLVNSYENTSSTTDKTYAIYSGSPISVYSNIDYNNYYTSGGTGILGYIGVDRPTLTDMITGFGGNTHSINEAAPFVSVMDLHIPAGTTTPLESAGVAIAGLTSDIDNQVRPGPTGSTYGGGMTPDIGADEFDGVPIDGTAPLISYTSLTTSTCATGDRTLSGVTISDFSGVPTAGALMPRIYFKKNTGSWYSSAGTLASGIPTNGTWNFTISAATMGGLAATDVVYYYVIAQDVATIPNLSAYPGVGFAATDVNTVTTAPATPNTFTILPTLSGNYTVGAGGNYPTITAAVNAYNTGCLAGNVTFLLTDASYSTGETFPIVVRNNPNAGPLATLTIKPQTGVAATITGSSSAAAVIKLLNAQFVTIDGVNTGTTSLALNNSNTGNNTAIVWLASTVTTGPGNKNISLLNMNMTGGGLSSSNWAIMAGVDGTTPALTNGRDNDSVTIQGNTVKRCGYAVVAAGTAASAAGGLDGWVVKNNVFGPSVYSTTDNLSYNGMFMRNMTTPVLSGNTIQNVGSTTIAAQSVGVYMEAGVDGAMLDSNIISAVQGNFAGGANQSVVGIYLGGSVINTTISRNKISSIYNWHTSGYGARGITVYTGTAASNANIVNNFISDVVSYSNTTVANWPVGIGMDAASTGGVNIYNNSINLSGPHIGLTSATGSADILINAGGGNINMRNNILVNAYENTSSTTDKTYAIYSTAANTVFSNIDYNDYYTSGGTPMLGNIGGTDRPTLTDMITGFGGNTHSINNSALFMSSTDLHLQAFSGNVPLIAGTPIVTVPNDIDGISRSTTTPVIGADEVNIPPCSGAPTPGVVTATVLSSCGTFNSNLVIVGSSLGAGLNLQWQSSPDSTTWTNIAGETDLTYSPTVAATTYYRATITCTISTLTDVTPGFKLVSYPFATITGPLVTCAGGSITLSATPAGGTWVSGATSTATIDATTGVATGGAVGTAPITYTTGAGCVTRSAVAVVSASSIPVVTPAAAVICEGGSVPMNAVATYSGVATVGTATVSIPVAATVDGYYSPLSVSIPAGATITSASVYFNITTTYVGDLTINLTAPNGNTLNLFNRHGGGGDNMVNTVVSSTGVSAFGSGAAPYTGTFAATAATGSIGITGYPVNVTTWASLLSVPNGTWTFSLRDNIASDATAFNSWGITLNYTMPSDITWSPTSTLYTSADLLTPYTGAVTNSVYAKPTAPGTVTTINTYSATASIPGCSITSPATALVTVNPLPSPIVGSNTVCHGLITTLSESDAGGTWISTNAAAAAIGSTSGVVDGVTPGVSTISYTFTGTGCTRTTTMTVNATPDPITGIASVCQSATTILTSGPSGGTWSSGTLAIATVNASSGEVSGVAAGLSVITYTLPTSCIRTKEVTVNPLPIVNITPATSATICEGESTSFSVSSPLMEFSILNQDFNSGLGTWVINTPVDPADGLSPWNLVSASAMAIPGDGTPMVEAAPYVSSAGNLVQTYLTSPSFSTIGFGSANLTFNEHLYSIRAYDAVVAVQYSIDGGSTWNTFMNQYPASADTTVGTGSWVASSPEVSVPLPGAALNVSDVRLRWFYESNWGGWWEIDNIAVKAALPAATFAWAGIGTADGLSCTTCTTPTITPTVPGANVYNVTASSTCSTTGSVTVNVNPLPGITGATSLLCTGSTTALGSGIAGGTWASSNNAVATVDASTGVVTGISLGSVVISYTLPTTCGTTVTLNINQTPDPISGVLHVCETQTTSLGDATTGGTWSSADMSVTTTDLLSGLTTGVAHGTSVISYIVPSGCYVTANATVDPLPGITGAASLLCTGNSIALGSSIAGGTWVSSNNAVATVDASTGVVTGVSMGSVVISYTLPTTCGTAVTLNVNQAPGPITGTLHICEGLTTALGNSEGGGSWSSSDLSVATINSVSGLTTSGGHGTSTITYALPSGCQTTAIATVDLAPTAFTGSLAVCEGSTANLGTTPSGGTWVSGSSTIAVVDLTTGVVTGMAHGTANITYTSSTGCERIEVVTVNELPANIIGTMQVCQGLTTTLSNATGSGTWSSSDMAVATVDAGGVVSGLVNGTTIISYTLTSTGCYKTEEVTVNALPDVIDGTMAVCEGLTTSLSNTVTGGTWISSDLTVATIDLTSGAMTGVVFGTTNITYTLPTGCISSVEATVNPVPVASTGIMQVCEGLTTNLVNTTGTGTWSSDDILVAGVDPTGMVTGNTFGTAHIIYTLPTGCADSATVTVNPLPGPIGVSLEVCEGLTTSLTNSAPDGTWSSSAPIRASVDPLTGVMAGVAAGNATITYTLLTGCMKIAEATVNPLPVVITGPMEVCKGATTTLINTTPGGTWSNDISGVATVDAAGVVSGIAGGTASISYILGTGCMRTAAVIVNMPPADYSVTGGGGYCAGTGGALVGLGLSELNVNYDLYQGSTLVASATGTGSAISFGSQSVTGTYTVFATNTLTSCANGMTGSVTVSITPLNIPAVTVATAATTVCSGIAITYTATPVNGGTLPVYNWEINGTLVPGATSATYSYNPVNGDIVKVTLNSNEICAIPSTATDLLTMTVNTSELPVATISVPNTTVCAGSGATFSVAPTFGGTTPSYEWFVNGTTTGVTSTVYTYVPSNGDVVTCKMASNFTCRLANVVTSNSLLITTTPISLPVVSLAVSPSSVIAYGTPVTFSAIVTGIGTVTPSYQWVVNNTVQSGATSSTFTSSTLNNNDSVTCKVNISDPCGFENFNSIVMRVKKVGVSQVFGAGNIMLVPNPNQGDFVVKGTIASQNDEEVYVEVVDMLGQIVYKGHTVTKNGALNERIKLSNTMANGMYMLNLRTATESAVFHFVLEQ